MRTWLRRLAALTASLVAALLLAEGVLRLAWVPPKLRATVAVGPHAHYGWAPLPGLQGVTVSTEYEHAFVHTSQRMRGTREISAEQGPGIRKRVLFLGDSFTYGVGAGDDETFAARIDRAWPDTAVVNAGCNGYGTRESLAVLDRLGAAIRPDMTVLFFFWNDLEDNANRAKPEYRVAPSGRIERVDPVEAGAPGPLEALPQTEPRQPSRWNSFYLDLLVRYGLKGLRYRLWGISKRSIRTDRQLADAWAVTDRLLAVMARRASEIGTRLVVVPVPNQSQVRPDVRIKNIEPINYEIQARLAEACGKIGVECIDVRAAMQAAASKSNDAFYYYADRHLTPEGHRVLAALVEKQLRPLLPDAGAAD